MKFLPLLVLAALMVSTLPARADARSDAMAKANSISSAAHCDPLSSDVINASRCAQAAHKMEQAAAASTSNDAKFMLTLAAALNYSNAASAGDGTSAAVQWRRKSCTLANGLQNDPAATAMDSTLVDSILSKC